MSIIVALLQCRSSWANCQPRWKTFSEFKKLTFWTLSVIPTQCADTAAAVLHLKTHEFSMHEHLIRPTTKYTESLPLCLAYSFVFGFGSPRPHRLWKFSVFSVWVKAQWEDKKFWRSIFLFWLFFDIAKGRFFQKIRWGSKKYAKSLSYTWSFEKRAP